MVQRNQNRPIKMHTFQKRSILYSLIFIFAAMLAGLAFWLSYKPVELSLYEDPKTGVSLLYPTSWEVLENLAPEVGLVVAFRGPRKDESDTFSPNANVSYWDVKERLTPTELKQVTMQQMVTLFGSNMTVLEDEPVMMAGNTGYKFVFVGKNVKTPNKFFITWTLIGKRVYVFTYANTAENFKDYADVAKTMMKSIRVK